jgi:hypothetical protein
MVTLGIYFEYIKFLCKIFNKFIDYLIIIIIIFNIIFDWNEVIILFYYIMMLMIVSLG